MCVKLSLCEIAAIDCKTVRIFAYSSTREQSNKRSGMRLKTESETGERRFFLSPHTPVGRVRLARFARVRLLRHALPISLLILRKKPSVLQSNGHPHIMYSFVCPDGKVVCFLQDRLQLIRPTDIFLCFASQTLIYR